VITGTGSSAPRVANHRDPAHGLQSDWFYGKFPLMKTLTVDSSNRIRIPDAKPHQVFSYENHGDGTITLTQVKTERKSRFPKGSLTRYFSGKLGRERDELELALVKGSAGPE
jgi:hypothetical protein